MEKNNSIFSIDTKTKLFEEEPGVIIPNFDDDESQIKYHWFNAFGADLSNMDLSVLGDKIKYLNFDEKTIFPSADKLPASFNPQKLLENGKNPGLGVRDLHKQRITGKGITVAILDNGFNINHQEIKDNLIHYEIIGKAFVHYHGSIVSSLLCGKNTGVAPDAKLVFFATGFKPITIDENGKEHYSAQSDIIALRKILDMNSKLPDDEKISAVSISRGWYPESPESEEFKNVVLQLVKSGVFVLPVNADDYYGPIATFRPIDRDINSEPDDPKSYSTRFTKVMCLRAPAGGRTGAGPINPTNLMYWGANGGMSWATPYMVGVYALAKQVYPSLTPLKFFETANQTAYPFEMSDGRHSLLIQPKKLIEQLQQELLLQKQMKNSNQKD